MFRVILTVAAVAVAVAGAAPAAAEARPYKNCSQAHADGRYNIPRDDPAYWPEGDRDGDGLACEPKPR
ncbi:MAG: excalibur calcium-binding domain-containing protein [Mycolicibacterium hassiacum]|jgi:hypothetical protein